ncbi:MAG TPA: ECF-type sigma factor [Gemmataceae bacterium]|nr:ECF-type sigma factor [Gemmataceae bacterium]
MTHWLGQLRAGDQAAAQPLWERYFQRLIRLARARLQQAPRRAADEEDVALSAFASFCRGAAQGRFPLLSDRDDLWRLLVVITARKACHLVRDEARRAGGEEADLEQVVGQEPTPAFAAQVAEQCRGLLNCLGEAGLTLVALRKMDGYTNQEIAVHLDCSLRTVERKLRLIRQVWEESAS